MIRGPLRFAEWRVPKSRLLSLQVAVQDYLTPMTYSHCSNTNILT